MADTAYQTHAAQMGRVTRLKLKNLAGKAVLGKTSFGTVETEILENIIDMKVLSWVAELPGVRGYSERKATVTFDPASVDTRVELPADFDSLHPSMGGRIARLDSDGDIEERIEVITVGEYEQEWSEGFNRYEDRDDEVAYLYGLSANDRRFMEIKPVPSASTDYQFRYVGLPEVLDNDADELEAPLQMHEGIMWDVASAFAAALGNEKADDFQVRADRILGRIQDVANEERHRQGRVVHFSERGGYAALQAPE